MSLNIDVALNFGSAKTYVILVLLVRFVEYGTTKTTRLKFADASSLFQGFNVFEFAT